MGVDLERLLDGVRAMAAACGPDVPAADNPALRLGAALGESALGGRDKLTLVFEPSLAPVGAWVEQLVAESTGKEGTGIVPVDLEELGAPPLYDDDRVFVAVRLAGTVEPATSRRLGALAEAGHPVLDHELDGAYGLGGEFLRWELAVATAGAVLDIDPFDQPNVQESKDNTKRLLAGYIAGGAARVSRAGLGRRLRRPAGVHRTGRGRLGPAADSAPAAARRPQGRDHRRLWSALPAFHRSAPQGRAQPGFVPAVAGARPRRCRNSGPAVQLQRAQARPGARRPGGPADARVPCPARVPRRRRAGGPHPPARASEGVLRHVAMVGPGRMGGNMARRPAQPGGWGPPARRRRGTRAGHGT